ncbi:MAG: hypothetical protein K9L68_11025, partial [Spirochaetales bacterium]|nr:hypothetical protein [Spirochaetales bacterium]MCF7939118.1 hypothetical protein [Spirochaetales bacterium]
MEPAFQDIRPSSLIEHENWVDAESPLEEVYQRLAHQECDFLAVVTGKKVLGLCSRAEIGMLLGHRYGNSLFAKKPVREHLVPTHIQVDENQNMSEVLQRAFERPKDRLYDDIIVTDEESGFLGMISMQTLVTLQNRYFFQAIDDLKR